jgi:hypothetical protein
VINRPLIFHSQFARPPQPLQFVMPVSIVRTDKHGWRVEFNSAVDFKASVKMHPMR